MIFDIVPCEESGRFQVKAKFMGVDMERFQLHYQVGNPSWGCRGSGGVAGGPGVPIPTWFGGDWEPVGSPASLAVHHPDANPALCWVPSPLGAGGGRPLPPSPGWTLGGDGHLSRRTSCSCNTRA